MNTDVRKFKSHCPINYAQEIFGDKWSLLIIRDLMFRGKKYYGEFLNSDEKISTNILADRLAKLEVDGFIIKTIDENNHAKRVYALTQKAVDLMPMLLEMIAWSAKYDEQTEAPEAFIRRLTDDKNALVNELIASLGISMDKTLNQ